MRKYLIISVTITILLPLAALVVEVAVLSALAPSSVNDFLSRPPTSTVIAMLTPFFVGWFRGRKAKLPDTFLHRLAPLTAPILLSLLFSIPYTLITKSSYRDMGGPHIISSLAWLYIIYWLAFIGGSELKKRSRATARGALIIAGSLAFGAAGAVGAWHLATRHLIFTEGFYAYSNDPSTNEEWGLWLDDFRPFQPSSALAKPAASPSLRLSANHPRIDGDRELAPLYGAIVEALYAGLDEETILGYVRRLDRFLLDYPGQPADSLLEGQADLIFITEAPASIFSEAAEAGLKIKRTPIALGALVFMVNRANPVTGLSLDEIGRIYAGDLNNWREVGGRDQRIMAFTSRSGSAEAAMSRLVRRGRPDAVRWVMESRDHMGGTYRFPAVYRNEPGDLGCSFLGYAEYEQPYPVGERRYLNINGFSPTPANMESGRYPLLVPIEALCLDPPGPETRAMLDWLAGPEGRDLIQRAGFIPFSPGHDLEEGP